LNILDSELQKLCFYLIIVKSIVWGRTENITTTAIIIFLIKFWHVRGASFKTFDASSVSDSRSNLPPILSLLSFTSSPCCAAAALARDVEGVQGNYYHKCMRYTLGAILAVCAHTNSLSSYPPNQAHHSS